MMNLRNLWNYGLCLGCFFLIWTPAMSGAWQLTPAVAVATYPGSLNLVFDPTGYPHIGYTDSTGVRHAYYNGTSWQDELVDPLSGTCSIDIDSQGYIHFAYCYYDGGIPGNILKYASNATGSWQIDDLVTGGFMGDPILDLDSSDYPHICYTTSTPSTALLHRYFDGSTWQEETAAVEGYFEMHIAMTLDNAAYPHIVYCSTAGDHFMTYAYKDGIGWHKELVDNQESLLFSIAADANRYPHIIYSDENNMGISYSYKDTGGWHWESVDNTGGLYSDIALNATDIPYIVYTGGTGNEIWHASRTGPAWNTQLIDSLTYMSSDLPSIAIQSDMPRVTYFDDDSGWIIYGEYAPDPDVPTAHPLGLLLLLAALGGLICRNTLY